MWLKTKTNVAENKDKERKEGKCGDPVRNIRNANRMGRDEVRSYIIKKKKKKGEFA